MEPATLREDMVDSLQHEVKGHITSPALALAMREVPRHEFVEGGAAYEDVSHQHGASTVLAPSMVASMMEALDPRADDTILIVGAGVGYTAAVAAELTDPCAVHAIDIDRELVLTARRNLGRAGYREVLVDRRDGVHGLPEYAPYDRILLEAAAINPPRALVEQLASGGRLVLPLGATTQSLAVVEDGRMIDRGPAVQFKPMLVEGEQATAIERNRMHREDAERSREALARRAGWEHDWIEW